MPSKLASDHVERYARNLRKLHRLIARDEGDSDAAERLRDALDDDWPHLSPEQAERARQLSADLNTLAQDPSTPDPNRPPDALRRVLQEAELRGDWPSILRTLRDQPATLPPAEEAEIRGRCWAALGDLNTAALFFSRAVKLNPTANRPALALIATLHALGKFSKMARVTLALADLGNSGVPSQLVTLVRQDLKARDDDAPSPPPRKRRRLHRQKMQQILLESFIAAPPERLIP